MKQLAGAVAVLGLTATVVAAQGLGWTYTRPAVPSDEALHRLHLKRGWHVYVPLEGPRDGLFSVQVLDKQLLVQSRSGSVLALDAATGATQWRVRPGTPYLVSHPVGYNAQSVFVVNGGRLVALNRATGTMQWDFKLPSACAAIPVADEERLFLPLVTGPLYAYELPRPGVVTASAPPPLPNPLDMAISGVRANTEVGVAYSRSIKALTAIGPLATLQQSLEAEPTGPHPRLLWEYHPPARLEQGALLLQDVVTITSTDGLIITLAKANGRELYRFQSDAPVSVRPGQHTNSAYVASQDLNLYAADILQGKLTWRFTAGAPILRKPEVTDADVYVSPAGRGLVRVDRLTGEAVWRNPNAERFLAANPRFVYATDRSNRLLVLDRARGTQLAVADTRDFVVPVSNELTDRLFLAANNGLLVCLHDRAYATPLRTKTEVAEPKADADKAEKLPPAEQVEDKQPEE
jgi:outer membrane protein assembly factor BamB